MGAFENSDSCAELAAHHSKIQTAAKEFQPDIQFSSCSRQHCAAAAVNKINLQALQIGFDRRKIKTPTMAEEVDFDEELLAALDGEENDEVNECQNIARTSISQNNVQWKADNVKLLLETRFSLEEEFMKGEKARSTLWNMIFKKMKTKNPNITVTVNEVKKKFSNMIVTYNRIKKRNSKTGRDAIRWKYYDDFDRMYGSKHNIVPPEGLIIDSLETENSTREISRDCSSASSKASNSIIAASISNKDYPTGRSYPKRKKSGNISSELLKYWQEEDAKEKQRHDEYMKVEMERNLIEKEKNEIEKEKISCLCEIKDILANLTNTNSGT